MKQHIWLHSDLQLSSRDLLEPLLGNAIDDLLSLPYPIDYAWCLGDAVAGDRREPLEELAGEMVAIYRRLNAPLRYVIGNHELDYFRRLAEPFFPLHDKVAAEPGWAAVPLDRFYWTEKLGSILVVFMGDHLALDGSWWVASGKVYGNAASYPYPPEAYAKLRSQIASHPGPVIVASHYALPGGQRPSPLLEPLLPLPPNVYLWAHGHAHIGDVVWNNENPWQRDNAIEGEDVRLQYNVSALENVRSPGSHSAILTIEDGIPKKLSIRCHLKRAWLERFVIVPE